MKKILFTILFLTSLTALSAQLQDSFLLVGSAGTFSALTDSTFRGTVTFQSDQFGSGYLPTGIQTEYKLIDAKGDIFTITAVNSSNFTTANIDVEEDDADRTAPAGIVMVFAVLPSGLYPVAPVNSTGISPIMEARLHMANAINRGIGLDVGTMTDSLNAIRDSLSALELELDAARTDSLDIIRDSINAVVSIPEKLPSQDITISAPSYTLRYDTINQHVVITENSQAYRSANGNIIISSEMGKTDIVGREFEINTDSLTDFTGRTVFNDKISGVIVENDAGEIRRSGTIIPFTDSLAVTTITSIDLGYRYKARYKLNCSSDPEIITLNLSNPIAGGVYTFRFFGVVDSITVAFSHNEDDETSRATFGVSDNSSKTFVFDSDGNYFLIPSASTSTTTTTNSFAVLDTLVTSAGWSPSSTLLDDYNYISAVIKIESGDGTNGTLGLPTPDATLTDLEFYVQSWDENGTYNPILSGGAGTIWYDSTTTNSVILLDGHTYRLHVDETLTGYIWVINDLTGGKIGLNKLATTAAGRLLLTDSGGAGTWVSGTPGYGLTISGTSMLADTSELATQYDLTQVGGSGNASGRALQTITADGTDTLNFGGTSYSVDYWQIDLSAVTSSTLNFTNPNTSIVPTYNLHFTNASTDTVIFASTFLDANLDTISSYVFSQGQIIPIYYYNSDYYTNYLNMTTSSSGGSISVYTAVNSEYQAILTYSENNSFTAPNDATKILQDTLIGTLKRESVWDSIELMYVFTHNAALDSFSLINWKDTANYRLTEYGVVSYSASGIAANDTSYLNTHWDFKNNPTVLDSLGVINFFMSDADINSGSLYSVFGTAGDSLRYQAFEVNAGAGDGTIRFATMSTSFVGTDDIAPAQDMSNVVVSSMFESDGATHTQKTYIDGTQYGSTQIVSGANVRNNFQVPQDLQITAKGITATPAWSMRFFILGKSLTEAKISAVHTALNTYVNSL